MVGKNYVAIPTLSDRNTRLKCTIDVDLNMEKDTRKTTK